MKSLHTGLCLILCLLLWPMATYAQDEIDIKLLQYGVGNVYRPGDITGMEIELTSSLPTDETVWVQWDHETSDSDVIAYGRRVTISPGQPRSTWLYVPLEPDTQLDTPGTIRVRSMVDGEPGGDLGVFRFQPMVASPRSVPRTSSLIGIVGSKTAGLEFYERSPEFSSTFTVAPEPTMLSMMAVSSHLPDRWAGLRSFETLVWTNAEVELSPAQEDALIDWIHRGGHLIVVLPQAGNPWSLGSGEDGPLGSIMPGMPSINESVPLMSLLPNLLKRLPQVTPSGTMPVHVFRSASGDLDAAPSAQGWGDLWQIKGIGSVAVQKPVGRGRLTVIGVDLTATSLRDAALVTVQDADPIIEIVPEPDVFWNPVLGRRSDTPLSRATSELRALDRLTVTPPSVRTVGDNLILGETDDVGQVGSGLLIAFFLFIVYWLVAIPLCWAFLKKRRWLHFSWLGFFLSTLLFTAIAWGTVALTRESSVQIRHLTVIDSVHGQDQQQAVSWLSLFTPGYGDYDLIIEGDGKDLLLPWEPSETRLSGFLDTRQTMVDSARASNRMTIPSRSTTTPLQLDWRGPIAAADWGDVLRMDPERPIHVVRNRDGQAVGLRGSIMSRLPGTLEDVTVLFVDREHPFPRKPDVSDGNKMSWVRPAESGRMEREGWHWSMVDDVPEGGYIMLDNQKLDTENHDLETSLRKTYSNLQGDLGTPMNPMNSSERRKALEALTVYHQLEPPQWIRGVDEQRDRPHAITTRHVGRELDLSAWMAQPVVIVMGFLPASELPIPLLINGEAPAASEGLVMVRWILPLQEDAPRAGFTTTGG